MTRLLYMDAFDVTSARGKVLSVDDVDGRIDIVLDQTCFYPSGGGQDYDQGIIRSSDARFMVDEVRLDEGGIVHHYGSYEIGQFAAGDEVNLEVDRQCRGLNTRLHSAGHLIDMAVVDELGYGWVPRKGAHYPHMSNVEYSGEWDADKKDEAITDIQRLVDSYVREGGQNEIRFMPKEEMGTICRHVPENLPSNKPARVVVYHGDFGVPCGGTHVADLSQVGDVSVDKAKKKNGSIRISYSLH